MADSKDDIEKYLNGELTSAEMHALEKKALSDPFLADAMEGAALAGATGYHQQVAEINAQLAEKIRGRSSWITPLRIAATLLLLVAVSLTLYLTLRSDEPVTIATVTRVQPGPEKKPEPTTVQPEPAAKEEVQEQKRAAKKHGPTELPAQHKEPATPKKPEAESTPVAAELQEPAAVSSAAGKASPAGEAPVIAAEDKAPASLADGELTTEKRDASHMPARPASPARSRSLAADVAHTIVRGTVRSADGPAPGVNVLVKGTTNGTVTDASGHYELSLPKDSKELVFSFIGYESKEVSVNNRSRVDAELHEDPGTLSEVVITSVNSARPSDEPQAAQPVGGERSFDDYLKTGVVYPESAVAKKIQGRVWVSFVVKSDGTLSDFKILRGIGEGCDEELIRLIKEGPSWIPMSQSGTPQASKVYVRYKFALPK